MANKKRERMVSLALALAMAFIMALAPPATALAATDEWLLMVQSASENSITLQWQPMEGAWAYAVYRSDTEDGDYERVTTIYSLNNLIYEDEDCKGSQGYYYRISYFRFNGTSFKESAHSQPIYAATQKSTGATAVAPITIAPIAAGFNILPFPSESFDGTPVIKDGIIIAVTPKNGSIDISWNAMDDAEIYHVCRSLSILGNYEVIGTSTDAHFIDSTCLPNTTYYYSIGAEKEDGSISKYVPMPKGATTQPLATPTPLPSPTSTPIATATPNPTPLNTPKPTPTPTTKPVITPSPITTPKPTAATPAPTTPVQPTTTQTTKPSPAPTIQPAAMATIIRPASKPSAKVINDNSVEVSWSQSKDAEGYNIYRSKDSAAFELAGSVEGKLKFTDSNLQSNAIYHYYITAVKGGLESAPTETLCAPLGRAVELELQPYTKSGTAGVELEWNRVSGAKTYSIYRSEDGQNYTLIKTTSSRSYDDKDLPIGATLWYRIDSDNGAIATASVHTGIRKLAVKAKQSGDSTRAGVSLAWDEAIGARYYEVYRSLDGSNYEYRGYTDAGTRAWLDVPLALDTAYYYKVVSSNGSEGFASQRISGANLMVLATPTGTGQKRTITIKWSPLPDAASYTIYRSSSSGSYTQVGVAEGNSWVDTNLDPLTTYSYRVETKSGTYGRTTSIALW